MGFDYGGFEMGFGVFGILFSIMFVLIIGTFVAALVKDISTWNHNNHSPRLAVSAMVVAKRTEATCHSHANNMGCWPREIQAGCLFREQDIYRLNAV